MGKALIIIVVGFTTIFSGIIFNISSTEQIISSDMYDLHQQWIANNNAESINNVILSKIYQGTAALTDTFNLEGSTGYFNVTNTTSDSVNQPETFRIDGITEYGGELDTIRTVFMRPAYSYYQYFVNTWNSNITHSTGDTLWGPVHSNDEIDISGSPVYMSSVSSTDNDGFNITGALTRGSVEFGIPSSIPIPDAVAVQALRDTIQAIGKTFNTETWIVFLNSGNFQHAPSSTGPWTTEALATYSGLIMSTTGVHLHVRGNVNGRVTVLSGNDILIESDLLYAADPLTVPTSDDYIGLIAADDIRVDFDTGPSSITIYGAFIAMEDLQIINSNTAATLTLNIVGSLIAEMDLFTGLNASPLPPFIFNSNHVPDTRLRTNCPPYFPRVPNRREIIYRSN